MLPPAGKPTFGGEIEPDRLLLLSFSVLPVAVVGGNVVDGIFHGFDDACCCPLVFVAISKQEDTHNIDPVIVDRWRTSENMLSRNSYLRSLRKIHLIHYQLFLR